MQKHSCIISLLCIVALVAGCKVGPNYKNPFAPVSDNWISGTKADPKAEIQQDWWKHFHDPVLDGLIAKTIAGNYDLKIASARIAQARAARANARSDLLPVVNTDANAEREGNRLAFGSTPFDIAKPFNTFQTGFDATWELDIFGGRRRAVEAANADLQAEEATADDARVSLLAEVARTYMDIRGYQAQLAIAQDTIEAEEQTARIAQERFKVGEVAGIDATQAEAQVKQAKSQIPYYQNLLLQAQFSMDVLLGDKPGTTQILITGNQPIPVGDKALVLAAPAKVISDRPDVRIAERRLASATAQQGVAVAQFYPDISLSGFLGLLSANTNTFLKSNSKSWDVGASVIWPILNYGKLSAAQYAADAKQQEALATYRKSVIVALSDVERSLGAYTKEQEHLTALEEAVKDDEKAVRIQRERYKEGLSSFLEVLDAERTLYAAQSQTATSRAMTAQNLVAVYKSLGGGWKDVKEEKAPETKAITIVN